MVGGSVERHDKARTRRFGTVARVLATPRHWAVWRLPQRGLVGYLITLDLAAVAGAIWVLAARPLPAHQLWPTTVLITAVLAYTELSRPIEKIREQFGGTPHISMDSVFMFAAVLTVRPALAALVITVSFGYRWLRVARNPLFRRTFSTAATILAGYAAVGFLSLFSDRPFAQMPRDITTFLLVAASGAVFLITNSALLTVAVYYGGPRTRVRDALGSPEDYALEGATIALGVILAWALADWPIALLLVLGVTLVLHRNILIRQLRAQARSDPKTGLLHAVSWSEMATAELDHAGRLGQHTSVLMLDLDRFKSINDNYGHIIGDTVLLAVADTLRAEVRANDLVGRFGGEEFVVLLPGTTGEHAHAIAERIRGAIATALPAVTERGAGPDTVTVSIGLATSPDHGGSLDEIMRAADAAVYNAKDAGRNRTHRYRPSPRA